MQKSENLSEKSKAEDIIYLLWSFSALKIVSWLSETSSINEMGFFSSTSQPDSS